MCYRKICLLVAVVALASAPLGAQAYQISPNPNPVAHTIIVNSPGATNDQEFLNNGLLRINVGGTLTNYWLLYNFGTLTTGNRLDTSGMLYNYGTLTNSAYLDNYFTLAR